MLTDRALPVRRGIELLAWGALVVLFVLVLLLPLPRLEQVALSVFVVLLGLYLAVVFHIVLPRFHDNPRVIYATLVIDVFTVGVLRFWLAGYLANLEVAFIPLVIVAALVAERKHVLALAVCAAMVDIPAQVRLMVTPRQLLSPWALLNQILIGGAFALTGLMTLFLVEQIRHHAAESTGAVALEKDRLVEREQKRAARFALVGEVGGRIAGLLDLDDLLNQVPALIVERFRFENVSILLNEPSERQVVLRSHAGRAIDRQNLGYRQLWDVGLIGLTARSGRTVTVNDVRADLRYLAVNADENLCRSELCVPLNRGSETLGVIDVQSTHLNAFDPVDVAAMELLAGQVAATIEKSMQFATERKRAAQLAQVTAIAERVGPILDPGLLLSQVAGLIREHFGFHNVSIMTLDAEAQELCLCAVSGAYADVFPSTYRQSVDVGLVGAAVRTGKTIVVEDVSRDSRFYFPPALAGSVGSEISIPLKAGAEVLGVLDIHAPKVSAFDACDVDAMEALANQMAIALNNARLCARAKDEAEVKAALLRELSHRVKNNLTAIAGLLYLGLDDDHIPREQVLSETLGRVQGLAIAHTLLAETSQARVDLLDLSRRIVSDAVHRMTLPGQVFPFTVQGPSVEISARQASSLALVLNELVTNAVKHGDRTPNPTCSLCIERLDGKTQLTLVNPGRLPEGFTLDGPSSGLGLKLVRTLVEKDLRGQFALSSSKGAVTGVVRFTPER